MNANTDIITLDQVATLDGLFRERVRRTPEAPAYLRHDGTGWRTLTWAETAVAVARWRAALAAEGLQSGARVALMLHNRLEWVLFDQAALAQELVVVPLYVEDRPENAAYILRDAGVELLLVETPSQWRAIAAALGPEAPLRRVVSLTSPGGTTTADKRLSGLGEWLRTGSDTPPRHVREMNGKALATLVYTSGTTGRPKGVMLSHRNLLSNAAAGLECVTVRTDDRFLSFLPLSHALERTVGYYLAQMAGASVAHGRSITLLPEDFLAVRPTVVIAVPRVFERMRAKVLEQLESKPAAARLLFNQARETGWRRFLWQQGRGEWHPDLLGWTLLDRLVARRVRARMGGRLRLAVCGGAPLPAEVGRFLLSLDIPVLQGYGLTEASPVVSVNRPGDNRPETVGPALPNLEVRLGDQDELLVRGPSVMQGYWRRPEATAAAIDADGWLHSGDTAVLEREHIRIKGRLKDIIVLDTGEKVPPADMEQALADDPLFSQVMVTGEGRPFLVLLAVPDPARWEGFVRDHGLDPADPGAVGHPDLVREILRRADSLLHGFPGYARIRGVVLDLEPWTVENGCLTPTLKLRRKRIESRYRSALEAYYRGIGPAMTGTSG